MNDSIDELKKAYREIKAPAHVATRIHAEVSSRPRRSHSWMPASATVAAVVLVAWLGPYLGEQSSAPPSTPAKPSLSAIAALKPDTPAGTSMSLSQLKTVKKPKLPMKPKLKATKPQTYLKSESDLLEEKKHGLS